MPTPSRITYRDIQSYLEAIASNPKNKRSADNSGHGRFWNVPYQQFIGGDIPNEDCNGLAIKIVDADPSKCAFYQSLKNPAGSCNSQQMPKKGPFITDTNYSVTLGDGSVVSGADIDANIVWWLTHGMPEM